MSKKEESEIIRPPDMSRGQRFRQFLYNPSTHEVLGRTGISWFKILFFYVVLYSFLAGFFCSVMVVFFQTLDWHHPKWTLDASIIGTSPGMGFRPQLAKQTDAFVSYKPSDPENAGLWTASLDSFLKPYSESMNNDNIIACANPGDASEEKSCRFDISKLADCGRTPYGYDGYAPCILLKLNKIYGWTPQCYEKEDIEKNDIGMPAELREMILALPNINALRQVWTSCTATFDNPKPDDKNVTVVYTGPIGFPEYYFPYMNQNGYQQPLVAVRLQDMPLDTVVTITCRLWAKNIFFDRKYRQGMTTMTYLIKP